jgi:DNA-binding transcriptional LysR family regulator
MKNLVTDWNSWQTLLAVLEAGTFDAAARQLRVDGTTVARRIRRLEAQQGGVHLLQRRQGRLQPSAACRALLPQLYRARDALTGLDRHRADDGQYWRSIRITAVSYLCDHLLAPALTDLRASSSLRLELAASNHNLNLTRREADFALRLDRPPPGCRHKTRLGSVAYGVFSSGKTDVDCLPWAGLDGAYAHLPESRWTRKSARVHSCSATGTQGLLELVRGGGVRALLPVFMARRFDLVMTGPEPVLFRPLWLLYPAHGDDTPDHLAVVDWIRATAGKALGLL